MKLKCRSTGQLVAWWHKIITWTNVDFLLVRFLGIDLRTISLWMPKLVLFCMMSLKFTATSLAGQWMYGQVSLTLTHQKSYPCIHQHKKYVKWQEPVTPFSWEETVFTSQVTPTARIKCGMKFLIHSQTSTVPPLKFWNGEVISSHTL